MRLREIPGRLKNWYLTHSMEFKAIPNDLESSYSQYTKTNDKLKVTFVNKTAFVNGEKPARIHEFDENVEQTEEVLNVDREKFIKSYDKNEHHKSLKKKTVLFTALTLLGAAGVGLALAFALPVIGITTSLFTIFSGKLAYNQVNDMVRLNKAKYFMENQEVLNKCAINKNNMKKEDPKFKIQKSNRYYRIVYKTLDQDLKLNINNIRSIGISKLKALKAEYEMYERINKVHGNQANDAQTEEEPVRDISLLLSRRG